MATQTIERPAQRSVADLEALFPGRSLSVSSFKRDGTSVATPVWFVSDGRRLFALTDLHSAKVRRMRRNPRVLIASCRADGKLRGELVSARAEVLTATSDLERVQELLIERYKIPIASSWWPTGSGAVSAASAASPTAPRWRSRSNSTVGSGAGRCPWAAYPRLGVPRRRV